MKTNDQLQIELFIREQTEKYANSSKLLVDAVTSLLEVQKLALSRELRKNVYAESFFASPSTGSYLGCSSLTSSQLTRYNAGQFKGLELGNGLLADASKSGLKVNQLIVSVTIPEATSYLDSPIVVFLMDDNNSLLSGIALPVVSVGAYYNASVPSPYTGYSYALGLDIPTTCSKIILAWNFASINTITATFLGE